VNKYTCEMTAVDCLSRLRRQKKTGVRKRRDYIQRKCWECMRAVDVYVKSVTLPYKGLPYKGEDDVISVTHWTRHCTQCYSVMDTGSYENRDISQGLN